MATTTSTRARGPRVRASGRGDARSERRPLGDGEQQYDLLTAALLGAMLGAGTTLLLRRPAKRRLALSALPGVPRGMKMAAAATKMGRRGSRWARRTRGEMTDRLGDLHVDRTVRGYLASARDRIDDAVSSELKDLRKALRRQRRRLGI